MLQMSKMHFKSLLIFSLIGCLAGCAPVSRNGLGNPDHPQSYRFAGDIWTALGNSFDLPGETISNSEVRKQIIWFMQRPQYLRKIAEQSRPYLYYIFRQVKRRGLPAELALLPMLESAYNPFAYSVVGAGGLWQMMPGTASGFGLKVDWWYDGRRDIVASTSSALDYLGYLGSYFNGDWLLAIAAYDTGEGYVNTAIQRNLKKGKPTKFWYLTLPAETQAYIPKLLAIATIIKNPYDYPVALPKIPNAPYLAEVNVGSQIDLARAAKMANISLQKLSGLNPGFNRWATDPDGPYILLLPIDKAALFKEKLAHLPASQRVTWMRHKVKSGDSLSAIAYNYKTTTTLLRKVNRLHNDNIRVGQVILIPTETSKLTHIVLHSEQRYLTSAHSLPEIHVTKHIVEKNETLLKIAKKYHVTPAQIRFWNGLRTNKLPIGEELIIWPPKKHLFSRQYATDYKVKPGDSLSVIAHRHHVSLKQLRQANHMNKHDVLYAGELLTMPHRYHFTLYHRNPKKITYRVKSGDTLLTIANKYHTTISNLEHWNRISDPNHLQANQSLVLYK